MAGMAGRNKLLIKIKSISRMTGAFYFVCKKLGIRNEEWLWRRTGWKAPPFIDCKPPLFRGEGDRVSGGGVSGWGIRMVGWAPLRWPDRAADAPHRGRAG